VPSLWLCDLSPVLTIWLQEIAMRRDIYQRQLWATQALEVVDDSYEVTQFTVEEQGNSLFVTRAYSPKHARSLRYFECYSIGPRGGVTLRGKTFSY